MNPTSVKDTSIFNAINPDLLTPKAKKALPFPLENFDEEIGTAYQYIERISTKIKAAETNPVNKTPARKRKLKSLKYKADTCLKLLKEMSNSCNELWF